MSNALDRLGADLPSQVPSGLDAADACCGEADAGSSPRPCATRDGTSRFHANRICSDDDRNIRNGVRKAHGFALTDHAIVAAVDDTILVADPALRIAAPGAPTGPPPGAG